MESSRRVESRSAWSIFVKFIFLTSFFKITFQIHNAQTKIDHTDLDLPRQILLFRGLRPFYGGALVCLGIDLLVVPGRPADLCALTNIVFARTSDNLVIGLFLKKIFNKLDLRS